MRYYLTILLFICWSSLFAATYEDGYAAYKIGDYSQAISIWLPLAEQGDAKAQNTIASMYDEGKGVAINLEEAFKWYKLAANQGQPNAQVSLGWYYMNGFENLPTNLIDYNTAKYWNELGAKNGCAEGYNNLGWLYENGLGVGRNYATAAELYQKAVTEGIRTGAKQNNIDEARSRLENIEAKLAKMEYTKKIKSNSSMQIDNDPLNIRN